MQPTPPQPPAPAPPQPPPQQARGSDPVRVAVGLLLAVPAAIALIVGYLGPSIRTVVWSFQRRELVPGAGGEWVGLDNYQAIGDRLPGPFGFALLLATIPLLLLLVVAPALAAAGHYAGRPARLALRLVLAVPMVCIVPVGLAMGWRADRFDIDGPRVSLWSAVGLSLFGLVVAVGVTLYLAVLRGQRPGRSVWPAGLAVGGLAAITMLAIGLQLYTYPYVITGGGPNRETATPMLAAFEAGLLRADLGLGAAQASLLLIPLMLLGIAAALLVILTSLRIELEPSASPSPSRGWGAGRIIAVVGLVLGLAVVLAVTLYGLWPWLSGAGRFTSEMGPSELDVLINTWLPPIASTVVGVGLAAVAGFGIGALRPLGRWSELLLLPFAPWLFIGIGPLMLVKFDSARAADRVDTMLGLIPPIWLGVPALFLFTVLFRGLESRRRQRAAAGAPAGLQSVLLPALPMLALVGAATWLVQSQSLLWGLLIGQRDMTTPVLVMRQFSMFAAAPDSVPLGLLLPFPLLLILAAGLGVLQWLYLDRLSIRVGRDREPPPPVPPQTGLPDQTGLPPQTGLPDQTGSISSERSAAES